MCVAAIMPPGAKAPSLQQLRDMERQNPDGAGLAWPQVMDDDTVQIAWEKGLHMDAERMHRRLTKLVEAGVGPVLFHFRYSTVGGKNSLLCHPFPLTMFPELNTTGASPAVMIHNGHWGDWEKAMSGFPRLFKADGIDPKDPRQVWSDTRCGVHLIAGGFIEQEEMGGKTAILTSDMKVVRKGHWIEDKETGIWYSNEHWRRWRSSEPGKHSCTYTPRRKGESGDSKVYSEHDWRKTWEDHYSEEIAQELKAGQSELEDRYKLKAKRDTRATQPIYTPNRRCYICDLWSQEYRLLDPDEIGMADDMPDGADYPDLYVCHKCDWVPKGTVSEPDDRDDGEKVVRLFSIEEVAEGLRAAEGLGGAGRRPRGKFNVYGDTATYDGDIRYVNGVPHWQTNTGDWVPMSKE